jgi:hypothetical protein
MNLRRSILASFILALPALADDPAPALPAPPAPPAKKPSKFVFSLLPKSLQRKPSLDFHVITELTPEGKKLTPATPQQPVYYLQQAGKFAQLGNNTPAGEHQPPVERLNQAMQRALAANGYLAATPKTALPAIAVVFNYGSFARFSTDADDMQQEMLVEQAAQAAAASDPNAAPPAPFIMAGGERSVTSLLPIVLSDHTARTDVLQRAELIGGNKFAHELAQALDREASYEEGGGSPPSEDNISSPFNQWANANENLLAIVDESFSSCYFVVASAYDYVAMKNGKRILLWRTKMTVNSTGISMTESLTPLIAAAAPYFGKDMPEVATISRQISRDGKVEIGTATVIDDNATLPAPAAKDGKNAKPTKP